MGLPLYQLLSYGEQPNLKRPKFGKYQAEVRHLSHA